MVAVADTSFSVASDSFVMTQVLLKGLYMRQPPGFPQDKPGPSLVRARLSCAAGSADSRRSDRQALVVEFVNAGLVRRQIDDIAGAGRKVAAATGRNRADPFDIHMQESVGA